MRFLFIFLLMLYFVVSNGVSAYVFGLKSYDNSLENIHQIEQTYGLNIPLVAIILDPYILHETLFPYQGIEFMVGKIFHFTVSPAKLTAKQVAKGGFDDEYREFFQFVKDKKIKVVFRTMHEMNGDRYPRAGNSFWFKSARKRIWKLSRQVGLDSSQILFDFSVNHRDKVTIDGMSKRCFLEDTRAGCKTREDYYPGEQYVDTIGFTFYNRGKATSDRNWLRPEDILIHDGAGLLERIEAKHKPVFIDEVATTKVRYADQRFDFARSQEVFRDGNNTRKDLWLRHLAMFVKKYEMIKGMVYFNIDYTAGLNYKLPSEGDRAVIDLQQGRYYSGVQSLLDASEPREILDDLFVGSLVR